MRRQTFLVVVAFRLAPVMVANAVNKNHQDCPADEEQGNRRQRINHHPDFKGTFVERQPFNRRLERVLTEMLGSNWPQIQERITSETAEVMMKLNPVGVLVDMEAEHTCMTLRGVRKEQSRMTTLASAGIYSTDPGARGEVLDLLTGRPAPAPSR